MTLTARVLLPRGDDMEKHTIKPRKEEINGNANGRFNTNPVRDTNIYGSDLPEGAKGYSTIVIAENIFYK